MKIVIAGGTGFIGRKLTDTLLALGHKLVILTRKERLSTENVTYVKWLQAGALPEEKIGVADAFINLAGVSINEGRWSKNHQKQIYESRMEATEELVRIITSMAIKPSVLVNASAIGIYPPSEEAVYTEASIEQANDFLGKTVSDWEKKAQLVEIHNVRTTFMRLGVVMGKEGGALPLMAIPYKMFVGGTVGTGKQWVSWVHVTDVIRALVFALEKKDLCGPINVTSPSPTRMQDFGKTIARVLHRPHWFPAPTFAMKLALGQKSALVLEGQHVLPNVLLENGFEFSFPELERALRDLLRE